MWLVFFNQPNIISPIQKDKDRGSVIVRCDVGENTWGYNARKFISRIIKNASIIIVSLPFSFLFSVNLTSFLNVKIIFFVIFLIGLLIFHIELETIVTEIRTTTHAIEKIEVLGSNTEKRFVIILLGFLFL